MMTPIIETSSYQHRAKIRTVLICRSPEHGAILRRQMVPYGLTVTEITQLVIDFTTRMAEWYKPQLSIVSRCESVLL